MNPQTINLAALLQDLKRCSQQDRGRQAGNRTACERTFSRLMNQEMKSVKETFFSGEATTTERACADTDWLEKFRSRLLSAGIPLKDLSLSPNARPVLEDILLAQGLSEGDVQSFLKELFGGEGRPDVKITQLLTKLSELTLSSDRKSREPVLEVSVLPHLEALLRCLGLDAVQARRALSLARVDGGEVNLKGLVQALKGILSRLPEETKTSVNGDSTEDVKGLLARIGMVDEASEINGPLSLNRFVQILEDKVAALLPHRVSEGEMENHINRLLGHVLADPEGRGVRASALRAGKHHPFAVQGPTGESMSNHLTKGIEEMVARGAWKTSRIRGKKSSVVKGLQEIVANGRRHVDESGQADNQRAGLLVKAKERMTLAKGGPLDQRVDQKTKDALYSAREAVVDRPNMAGTEAKQVARPVPLYVVNQVGRQMAFAIRRGENQVRVQLKPPNLGRIQVDMVMKDHVLKVAMITEHHGVKELLMSHVQELREALVEQGVELQRMDINIDYHFGQSLANAQRDLHEAHSWKSNLFSAFGPLERGLERAEEMIQANVPSDALVDMFA